MPLSCLCSSYARIVLAQNTLGANMHLKREWNSKWECSSTQQDACWVNGYCIICGKSFHFLGEDEWNYQSITATASCDLSEVSPLLPTPKRREDAERVNFVFHYWGFLEIYLAEASLSAVRSLQRRCDQWQVRVNDEFLNSHHVLQLV